MKQRVVVTGWGMISPMGLDIESSWQAAVQGRSGIGPITRFDAQLSSVRIAGELRGFDPTQWMPSRDVRRMDRFTQYFQSAASQAMRQSGLLQSIEEGERLRAELDPCRVGVLCGSAIGGILTLDEQAILNHAKQRVSPFFVPASLINIAGGYASIAWGLRGPNLGIASACASSSHAIGLGLRMIQAGDADIMLVGGAEAPISSLTIQGHVTMKALSSRWNDEPFRASRPWDADRDGFVLSEGAGAMVLERLDHAQARGAHILAEVLGFGMGGDAHHLTSPSESGLGAARCMRRAIHDAGLLESDIDHVNAHGTSTPLGDLAEAMAIGSVFGSRAPDVHVCSTKSMTGHLMGAAGVVEAIFASLALRDSVVPPTLNLDTPEPGIDLDFTPHHAVPYPVARQYVELLRLWRHQRDPCPGSGMSTRHATSFRIYWEDTDAGGVMYHGAYVRLFDRGRSEWLRQFDLNQHAMMQADALILVRDIQVSFKRPGRLDDAVTVTTELVELRKVSGQVRQVVKRGEDVLAEAVVGLAFLGFVHYVVGK
jgi:3-oxoacyl-[acyl-carrier-protein] synthase II